MDSLKDKIQKSSKTMAFITKILCISLIIGLCVPIIVLVWYTVAPDTNFFALRELGFYSSTGQLVKSTGELIAEMLTIIVSGVFVLDILLIANRIFHSIGIDIMPFSRENAMNLKKIAKVLLVYSIVEPISKAGFYSSFVPEVQMQSSLNIVSIILAFVFFFVSVVFAYGAELQRQFDETL
ncbi:DUF2975 family protein [Kineothrix alysoides]|uniref:DUF2975 family protein n=1 Tax=Kineothrix alysoides TaxID=1469948 RepID=A0A4R1QU67_9FIRM|nr:DUF2975 domain-containing protein [Kineothrix alysoides]TCL53680.1 DUF2975 family protein [Kineothrix alysoides]